MSRQAPPRKQAPRSTPSRVKPADSRAFCSAMLALSVLASIRFTCVWANRYSASRRWASLPKPLAALGGKERDADVPAGGVRALEHLPPLHLTDKTAVPRGNGQAPALAGDEALLRPLPTQLTGVAVAEETEVPCLRRILVEALQKIEVGFDDGAQAHGLGHGATVATAAARPDGRPRRHSASAPAVCVRPRRVTQSPRPRHPSRPSSARRPVVSCGVSVSRRAPLRPPPPRAAGTGARFGRLGHEATPSPRCNGGVTRTVAP